VDRCCGSRAECRGAYRYALSSDDAVFGGSGTVPTDVVLTDDVPYHGFAQSMLLTLPPLSAVVLLPEPGTAESAATLRAADEVPAGIEVAVPASELAVQELGTSKRSRRVTRHGAALDAKDASTPKGKRAKTKEPNAKRAKTSSTKAPKAPRAPKGPKTEGDA
jgi:1,4-alpha-glucan branching enzyme